MRALLIDPWDRTITEVEVTTDYRDIKQHLSRPDKDCVVEWICTGAQLPGSHTLYVDDEFLLKPNARDIPGYLITGQPQVLGGMGLICGIDHEGETAPCRLTVGEVETNVTFVGTANVGVQPRTRIITFGTHDDFLAHLAGDPNAGTVVYDEPIKKGGGR